MRESKGNPTDRKQVDGCLQRAEKLNSSAINLTNVSRQVKGDKRFLFICFKGKMKKCRLVFFSVLISANKSRNITQMALRRLPSPIRPSSICTPMALRNACSATEQYRKSTKLEREPLSFQMDSEKCTPNIIK